MPKFMIVAFILFVVAFSGITWLWSTNWLLIVKLVLSSIPLFLFIVGVAVINDSDEWEKW